MTRAAEPSGDAEAQAAIWEIVRGPWRYAALHAFAELGCADHLAAGPATAGELARHCRADPASLTRLLRCCAAMGLTGVTAAGRYTLTPAGRALRRGGPMRAAVLANGNEPAWQSMLRLATAVRTGQPVFSDIAGKDFYDWHADHPDQAQIFQEFMTARSAGAAAAIASLNFASAQVVADIGGGYGTVLAAVLAAHSHVRGIILERDSVLPGAREYLAGRGLDGRCELSAGDFFDPAAIPPADVYILVNILHNYGDDDAGAILRNITAAAPRARVILADILLPDDPATAHIGTDLDMRRIAMGGRERAWNEYADLLASAGLTAGDVIQTPWILSIIDARR